MEYNIMFHQSVDTYIASIKTIISFNNVVSIDYKELTNSIKTYIKYIDADIVVCKDSEQYLFLVRAELASFRCYINEL